MYYAMSLARVLIFWMIKWNHAIKLNLFSLETYSGVLPVIVGDLGGSRYLDDKIQS